MADVGRRQPFADESLHSSPQNATMLASPAKSAMPGSITVGFNDYKTADVPQVIQNAITSIYSAAGVGIQFVNTGAEITVNFNQNLPGGALGNDPGLGSSVNINGSEQESEQVMD
jgi:hypothetical protein